MKSQCWTERLKRVLKSRFQRKSSLVTTKRLCNCVRARWGAPRARTCTVQGAPEGDWGGPGLSLRTQAGALHWDRGEWVSRHPQQLPLPLK